MNKPTELREAIIKSLSSREKQKVVEANHYEHAQRIAGQNLEIAQRILGNNHPLCLHIKRDSVDKVHQYVDITTILLKDTLVRWGKTVGIEEDKICIALTSLIDFDWNRIRYFDMVRAVILTLLTGIFEEDGEVSVGYHAVNTQESGVYKFYKLFAARALDFYSNRERGTYEAYRDTRVPWLYIYASELGELESHMNQTFDIMSAVYHGESEFSNGDNVISFLRLSEETRSELAKVGCLVLHPTVKHHITQGMKNGDEPGVILVPILRIPWIRDGQPTNSFTEWTLSQFEHETKHHADSRIYNGIPVSIALLETRAFLKQVDFHERNGQLSRIETVMSFLLPYLSILSGVQEFTHQEKNSIDSINNDLNQLSPEALELVWQVLVGGK